jgi:DNA-binding beta-propeller fold protein YncE
VPGFAVDGAAGRLFVPDGVGRSVSLFDTARGQYLRAVHVGALPVAVAVDPQTRRAFVASLGPMVPAGVPSSVSVLDSASGRVLHTVVVGHYPALVAVDVAGGRVLVVHGWAGRGDAQAGGQGIGGGGATDVLDARSGRLLATLPAGAVTPEAVAPGAQAALVAVDERRGHVFVLEQSTGDTAAGRVRVLDDRKPRVLRSVAVAPFPIGLAVDALAGRLFVLHAYADCHAPSSAWAVVPASVRRWLPFLPPQAPGQAQPACTDHGSVSVFDLAHL